MSFFTSDLIWEGGFLLLFNVIVSRKVGRVVELGSGLQGAIQGFQYLLLDRSWVCILWMISLAKEASLASSCSSWMVMRAFISW